VDTILSLINRLNPWGGTQDTAVILSQEFRCDQNVDSVYENLLFPEQAVQECFDLDSSSDTQFLLHEGILQAAVDDDESSIQFNLDFVEDVSPGSLNRLISAAIYLAEGNGNNELAQNLQKRLQKHPDDHFDISYFTTSYDLQGPGTVLPKIFRCEPTVGDVYENLLNDQGQDFESFDLANATAAQYFLFDGILVPSMENDWRTLQFNLSDLEEESFDSMQRVVSAAIFLAEKHEHHELVHRLRECLQKYRHDRFDCAYFYSADSMHGTEAVPDNEWSPLRRKITAVALFALMQLAPMARRASIELSKPRLYPRFAEAIKNMRAEGRHFREIDVASYLGPDALTFEKDDPRGKVVIMSTWMDHNGAMNLIPTQMESFRILDSNYDVGFSISRLGSDNQICDRIQEAAATGPVAGMWIEAHGCPTAISFADPYNHLTVDTLKDLPPTCFDGLDPSAVIVLDSCETGGTIDGFAHALAVQSQRPVISSTDSVVSLHTSITGLFPIDVSFKETYDHLLDSTRVFYPDGTYKEGGRNGWPWAKFDEWMARGAWYANFDDFFCLPSVSGSLTDCMVPHPELPFPNMLDYKERENREVHPTV
jgi:hypothetical protein